MTDPAPPQLFADPANLLRMGLALVDSGEGDKALALVEKARAACPGDAAIAQASAAILARGLPDYHQTMLNDAPRNAAYSDAIARAAPGIDGLLDIGAGSGLLAMVAARAGAKRVVACEANRLMAASAERIIAANAMDGQVRLIARHSTELDPDRDLGGRVALIVTETFGPALLDETVLPSLADALERLAIPGAKVIPARASVRVALAALDRPGRAPVADVCGFDLGALNRHWQTRRFVKADSAALTLRSAPASLFDFDLAARDHPISAALPLVSLGGRVDGLVQWLRLDLDAQASYENEPGRGVASHWAALFWPLPEPVESEPGRIFSAHGWHDRRNIVLWTLAD